MEEAKPWELEPELTEERLRELAAVFRDVRQEALHGHEPSKGDNAWVFGTRAYARTCAELSRLEQRCPWLRVEFDNNACTIWVGDVPIKFYRGDSEKPKAKSVASVWQLSFLKPSETSEWCWLLAIETFRNGTVQEIVLFQTDEFGETRHPYSVPLDPYERRNVIAMAREGVDLPPPKVGQRRTDEAHEEQPGVVDDGERK